MGFYVNPPADAFKAILRSKTYIDKSGLIAYMNQVLETSRMLTCFSRPRRFGKSFAAKMLAAYYSRGADSRELFEDLEIAGMKDAQFEENLNRHDVLFFDMTSFISMADSINDTIRDLQSDIIHELKEIFPNCINENIKSLFKALMQVHAKTGRKFFIIIDEWDALFREAQENEELQKEYIQLLRSMFKSSQTSQVITGAYMTGILPIKKYGTQSALTDFKEYTMLEPGVLTSFIGFTDEEVRNLCAEYNLAFDSARKWYDGYFPNKTGHIYCPNSIMEAVSNHRFSDYWTKTETYESLKTYIDMNYDGLKDAIVDLLGEKRCRIDTGTFQNDMTSLSGKDDIFTLLVHLGYLAYDMETEEVFIPNEEVRNEFIRAIREGRRPELAKAVRMSDKLLEATLCSDETTVARILEDTHETETMPINYNNEQALRYVVIMAYLSAVDHYLRFEELASGKGYSDILFLPRNTSSKPALLIELKWNKNADKALSQITDKNYAHILRKFNYTGEALLIGINYNAKSKKHTCKIKKI